MENFKYEDVSTWLFASDVKPAIAILVIYLSVVLYIGPEFMKNREPWHPKTFMRLYNLFLIILNAYVMIAITRGWYQTKHETVECQKPLDGPLDIHQGRAASGYMVVCCFKIYRIDRNSGTCIKETRTKD